MSRLFEKGHVPPQTGNGKGIKWIRAHVGHMGDDCLIWPYNRLHNGYGTFGYLAKLYYAHRFMCEAAHGVPPSPKHEAAHSCGNGHLGCANPRHLSWKTKSENSLDRRRHGTTATNSWGPKGKLTRDQVIAIRELKGVKTQAAIARQFDISEPTVRDIHSGRSRAGVL